ncbi:MAG: formate/nitrite transporter family protein [Eubacteriales bacterium]|nr:formate/nitrite transporter family protein [Eubacteriales bacterium]
MNYEDVQKLSNAAKAKIGLLKGSFLKYFLRAVMAGFFIDVAMIYSNVVGNVFSKTMPEWGKFLGALVFSIAVLLICLVGGELFTGNNLVMAFGAYGKDVTWGDAGKVWAVSYLGNFVGCLIFALLFVGAGASGTADYYAGFINNKLTIPLGQMFLRAVLCNFFVCLGVLCGIKLKSETAKFLMIVMCISGFVVSGFEHCIANMGNFVAAFCLVDGLSLGLMLKSMVVVTLGNMVGGALLLAWPLRKMSADQ